MSIDASIRFEDTHTSINQPPIRIMNQSIEQTSKFFRASSALFAAPCLHLFENSEQTVCIIDLTGLQPGFKYNQNEIRSHPYL